MEAAALSLMVQKRTANKTTLLISGNVCCDDGLMGIMNKAVDRRGSNQTDLGIQDTADLIQVREFIRLFPISDGNYSRPTESQRSSLATVGIFNVCIDFLKKSICGLQDAYSIANDDLCNSVGRRYKGMLSCRIRQRQNTASE